MAKVTGEMILAAIASGQAKQDEAFKQFSDKIDLKLNGVENGVNIRLDAQKEKINKMEIKMDELSEHVGIIRFACTFAKWFKPKVGA